MPATTTRQAAQKRENVPRGILGSDWGMSYNKLKPGDAADNVAVGKIQSGLYIVQPAYAQWNPTLEINSQKKYRLGDCYRCGAVGTKAYVDEKEEGEALLGPSSLRGRMMMYDSNWLGGGTLYAFLDLDRPKEFVGGSATRREKVYVRPGEKKPLTLVKQMERVYHERLRGHSQLGVAKEKEWFHGAKEDMLATLISLAGGQADERLHLFYKDGVKRYKVVKVKEVLQIYESSEKEPMTEKPLRPLSQRPTKANEYDPSKARSQLSKSTKGLYINKGG